MSDNAIKSIWSRHDTILRGSTNRQMAVTFNCLVNNMCAITEHELLVGTIGKDLDNVPTAC